MKKKRTCIKYQKEKSTNTKARKIEMTTKFNHTHAIAHTAYFNVIFIKQNKNNQKYQNKKMQHNHTLFTNKTYEHKGIILTFSIDSLMILRMIVFFVITVFVAGFLFHVDKKDEKKFSNKKEKEFFIKMMKNMVSKVILLNDAHIQREKITEECILEFFKKDIKLFDFYYDGVKKNMKNNKIYQYNWLLYIKGDRDENPYIETFQGVLYWAEQLNINEEKYKNDIIQHRFFDAVQQDNSKKQKLNLYKHLNNHDQKLLKILKKDPFASFQIIQHGFNSLKELQPNTKYKLTSDIPSNKTAPSYMS